MKLSASLAVSLTCAALVLTLALRVHSESYHDVIQDGVIANWRALVGAVSSHNHERSQESIRESGRTGFAWRVVTAPRCRAGGWRLESCVAT